MSKYSCSKPRTIGPAECTFQVPLKVSEGQMNEEGIYDLDGIIDWDKKIFGKYLVDRQVYNDLENNVTIMIGNEEIIRDMPPNTHIFIMKN